MPIYEYVCQACGCAFEKLVPNDRAKIQCPQCESARVSKQFSAFAAHNGTKPCSGPSAPPCAAAGGGCRGCPRG